MTSPSPAPAPAPAPAFFPSSSSLNHPPKSLLPYATSFPPPLLAVDAVARRRSFPPLVRASTTVDAAAVLSEEEEKAEAKIGARVRVKVPLKVYHVPRVPETDLTGKEGVLKQYVVVWKGKRISANLPFKVEFFADVEGRGKVKFFAHLKEDEFEYLD
ncbi:hypothetical protein TEA_009596 [Camellia sinensis var. sinensis]|uniref:Ferredoxin thioredoxin reductase alpha chain domain-containing protein n=2 Tax=Camellia sinensis TaxID=4442 RepID=A0A4S4DTH0_CAMSN|nr:hypothetical protein TEA_009596 [Camellia sinensis var. sinensis]